MYSTFNKFVFYYHIHGRPTKGCRHVTILEKPGETKVGCRMKGRKERKFIALKMNPNVTSGVHTNLFWGWFLRVPENVFHSRGRAGCSVVWDPDGRRRRHIMPSLHLLRLEDRERKPSAKSYGYDANFFFGTHLMMHPCKIAGIDAIKGVFIAIWGAIPVETWVSFIRPLFTDLMYRERLMLRDV